MCEPEDLGPPGPWSRSRKLCLTLQPMYLQIPHQDCPSLRRLSICLWILQFPTGDGITTTTSFPKTWILFWKDPFKIVFVIALMPSRVSSKRYSCHKINNFGKFLGLHLLKSGFSNSFLRFKIQLCELLMGRTEWGRTSGFSSVQYVLLITFDPHRTLCPTSPASSQQTERIQKVHPLPPHKWRFGASGEP